MDNALALLIILALCLVAKWRFSLCLVIAYYYMGYLLIESAFLFLGGSYWAYYLSNFALDVVVLTCIAVLIHKRWDSMSLCSIYAVTVALCALFDVLSMVDQVFKTYAIVTAYELTQQYSNYIDLAAAGWSAYHGFRANLNNPHRGI